VFTNNIPPKCCRPDNSLNIDGVYEDNVDGKKKLWLFQICIDTRQAMPSAQPSIQPTVSDHPSIFPTMSEHPTIFPSMSKHPSIFPSAHSSILPTASDQPSILPTAASDQPSTSDQPSASDQPSILPAGENIIADVPFMLGNDDGIVAAIIFGDSVATNTISDALEDVVNTVVDDYNAGLTRRSLGLRGGSRSNGERRLLGKVIVQQVSLIGMVDTNCPDGIGSSTVCQSVDGQIEALVVGASAQEANDAKDAIEASLQLALANLIITGYYVWPAPAAPTPPGPTASPVTPALIPPTTRTAPVIVPIDSEGTGAGVIATLAGGAVFLGLFAIGGLYVSGRRETKKRKRAGNIESAFGTSNRGSNLLRGGGGEHDRKNNTLGASDTNYGIRQKVPNSDFSSLSDAEDHDISTLNTNETRVRKEMICPSLDSSLESSSNAGSSGWSSSAGMSSLNTASVDSVEHGYGSATTLAAIGKQSGIHNKYPGNQPYAIGDDGDGSNKSDLNENGLPDHSHDAREKLNAAIEAKNWVAVGTTAALLASCESTASKSLNSNSGSTSTSGGTYSTSSINELNVLLADEDYEGIVLYAAKFELESTGGSTNGSISTEGSSVKGRLTGEDSSYVSAVPSVGDTSGSYVSASEGLNSASNRSLSSVNTESLGSYSGTPSIPSTGTGVGSESQIQRRAEIRLEVAQLVETVVPDEKDNVDEMMKQFRGREEELVETLRTMQERSIAQREREEMRRNAKREARKSVRKSAKGVQGSGGGDLGKSLHGVAARSGLPPTGPRAGGKKNAGLTATANVGIGAAAAADARRRGHVEAGSSNSSLSELSNNSHRLNTSLFSNRSKQQQQQQQQHLHQHQQQLQQQQQQQQQQTGSITHVTSPSTTDSSKISSNRIELERAIEDGDWDAVGAAAAKMGEGSVSSAGFSDFASLDSSTIISDERGSLTSGSKIGSILSRSDTTAHNDRAMELERFIERGEWTRVVAAAGKYSDADRQYSTAGRTSLHTDATQEIPARVASGGSTSAGSSWGKIPFFGGESKLSLGSSNNNNPSAGDTDGGRKNRKTSKEEKDALAQADIWMTIAKQSKNEGSSGAKGASDAADWAISRSLTAMKNADQQQTIPKTTNTKSNPVVDTNAVVVNNESASSRRRNQRSKKSGSRSSGSSDGTSL